MTGQNEEGASELAAQAGAAHAEGEHLRVWPLLQKLLKQREQGEAKPARHVPPAVALVQPPLRVGSGREALAGRLETSVAKGSART